MKFEYFEYSDKGPRLENEDALSIFTIGDILYSCIADGVGGSKCGKLASNKSVESFAAKVKADQNELERILLEIHEQIKELQATLSECIGMATTFTGCIIQNYSLYGIQVGDSRLCILRGNGIKQLTDVHTEASRLFKSGKLSAVEYQDYPRKHIIESALGITGDLTMQSFSFDLLQGDRIILTTDGVHDVITKTEFRDLSLKNRGINEFGQSIIGLLSTRKISDNTSFIAISIA